MGNITPNAPAAGVAARVAQVHRIAGERFLIAFLGRFFNKQDAGAFRPMIGESCLPIPGSEAAGVIRPCGDSRAQIHKRLFGWDDIQSGPPAHAACTGSLGAGYSVRVIDPGALRPSEDLYKSFSTCAEDR